MELTPWKLPSGSYTLEVASMVYVPLRNFDDVSSMW